MRGCVRCSRTESHWVLWRLGLLVSNQCTVGLSGSVGLNRTGFGGWCALGFARSACLISGGVAERVFSDSEQLREKPRDLALRTGRHG